MKREIIKVCVAVLLTLAIGGYIWYAYQPRLVCKESSVVRDAIPIARDQTTFEHIYTVHNKSLQTITIDDIKSSCNCQSVTFDRVIPPRSTGEVKATFAVARNAVGRIRADFLVLANTNKLDKPLLHLQMTYSFELGVWAHPAQINLGRVVSGKSAEFTINVRQEKVEGRKAWQVESVETEGIAFEVLPVQDELSSENASLLSQKVIGRFTNDFSTGFYGRDVSVHVDHPDYPLLRIPVRWESVAELSFAPTTLHFWIMEAGSKTSRAITLISASEQLNVQHAEVSGEGFRLESRSQIAPNRVQFMIEAHAGTAAGVSKGQLKVTLPDGTEHQAGLLFIVE